MSRWRRRTVGAVAAGLCLFGVLGLAAAAAADDAPAPAESIACGGVDLWAGAGLGTHVSTTAVLGSTSATLEGTIAEPWSARGLASPTLTIRDGGTTVRSGPVEVPADWDGPPATVLLTDIQRRPPASPSGEDAVLPLCVARFAGSQHPVVLMGMFTGGAHCCTILRAYPLTGSGSGAAVDLPIGNPGVDVRADPHGEGAVAVTADDAFNYEFASYASSGVPVKVLTFKEGGFTDITRTYPDLVRSDAAQWWKSFSDDPSQGLGSLAAWVADQCLLDHGKDAWSTLDRLLSEGKLAGPPDSGGIWPTGAGYVATLHMFLPQHGYCQ